MYILHICILAPFIQIGFSLIGEETDLNSLSSYEAIDDINENFELWNNETDAGIVVFDSFSQPEIEEICKNSNTLVYVSQEDVTVDCRAFNTGDKPIEAEKKLVKREAQDENEGSGDDAPIDSHVEDSVQEAVIKQETETGTIQQSVPETVPQNEDENTDVNVVSTTPAQIDQDVSTHDENKTIDQDVSTHHENIPPTEETVVEKQDEGEVSPPIITEIPIAVTESGNKENENQINVDVNIPEVTNTNQEAPQDTVDGKDKDVEVNEPNIKPSKQEHVPPSVTEVSKELEDKAEQGDKKKGGRRLGGPVANDESAKQEHATDSASDEGVKTEKSSEDTTKKASSKDTTILVVLFVAVVVVGALAFGYNFIKKRKQQSADLERVERASIKRSLQNLARTDNEPEKKPLMGDGKDVEMVDMKKSTSSLEATSMRTPNESTVKT